MRFFVGLFLICFCFYKSIHCGRVHAIQIGTHNICLYFIKQADAIQMGTHNICLYKEVDKSYFVTVCFIGVCAVIRSNTVDFLFLCKNICCGYTGFALASTHNTRFHGDVKISVFSG